MKNPTLNPGNSLSIIVCNTIGHNYKETLKVTNHISEFKCSCCGREVTNNFSGKLELLTVRHREVNASLNTFFEKKMRRITSPV